MKRARRRILSDYTHDSDSGMTLIEVLAAVIIIVIVALSAAGLTINGITTAAGQERQQVAVTIANGAMENISGKTVSNLISGRCQTDVTNAFTSNSAIPGVSNTYPTWDSSATCGCPTTISVPIVQSTTAIAPCLIAAQNGTKYTITRLIGTCYEPLAGGACSVISGHLTDPGTTTGYTSLLRIIVLVSWTAGSKCSATACYYETTTLADPHAEPTWVQS
jgi:prepilin-type N-terminal cleavage/methylation domain-containing protein